MSSGHWRAGVSSHDHYLASEAGKWKLENTDECWLPFSYVKALIKSHAAPGLWLKDAPEPTIGINHVLIRVLRTEIRQTDIHIFAWNECARHTIPDPMTKGLELVKDTSEVCDRVK